MVVSLLAALPVQAADVFVLNNNDSGAGSLRDAITSASPGDRILFSASLTGGDTITLSSMLPIIDKNLEIDGSDNPNLVIDGAGTNRAFFVRSGTVTIASVTIDNVAAQGGDGAGAALNQGVGGGGGGLGAGAAIFVDSGATVTVSSVQVQNSLAQGGAGGNRLLSALGGGGGGGGLGGDGGYGGGGNSGAGSSAGGGGGGGGLGGDGGNGAGSAAGGGGGFTGSGGNGGGGAGTGVNSGGGGGNTGGGGAGTGTAGSGGAGDGTFLGAGGGGGGGGESGVNGQAFNAAGGSSGGGGGNGGYGGGGGGGAEEANFNPGVGGDFGGGGGDGQNSLNMGGTGGYGGGGGGGGGVTSTGGIGGFGGGGGGGSNVGIGGDYGGNGGSTGGGGGGALGGAIFVRSGGSLTIQNSNFESNSVSAGTGAGNGTDGQALGGAIFLHDVDLNVEVTTGNTATIEDSIADNTNGNGGMASSLNKTGAGTLVLQGTNTYTGNTNVTGGLLDLSGSIGGDATVTNATLTNNGTINGDTAIGSGGTLKGNGTITGNVQNNGGTLAAGNSIGTATYGSLDFNSGTVEVEIAPGGNTPGVHNDYYQVTGAAVIDGGIVNVVSAPGAYTDGTVYTFLTAGGGISGTGFTSIVDDLPFFNAALVYGPNSIGFQLNAVGTANFAELGSNPYRLAVGTYLDVIDPTATGDLAAVFSTLQLNNTAQIQAAIDQIGGQIYPTMATAQVQQVSQNLALLRNQLALNDPCTYGDQGTGWIRGYGMGGEASASRNGAYGYEYGVGGTEFAFQNCIAEGISVGGFGNFSWSSVHLDGLNEVGTSDMYQFGLSLQRVGEFTYQLALAGGGFQEYEANRTISAAGLNRTASSSFGGNQGFFYLESGSLMNFRGHYLQPYAALQYVSLRQNGFTETGADSLNLIGDSLTADSFRGHLGMQFETPYVTSRGTFTPKARLAWMHEFADTQQAFAASFSGAAVGTGSYIFHGVDLGRDWVVAGVGLNYNLTTQCSFFAGYDAQFNSNQSLHTGSGGLEIHW